LRPLDQ